MSTPLQRVAYLRLVEALPDLAESVFTGEAPDRVAGSGAAVVSLWDAGVFAYPRSTGQYRRLRVDVVADRTRDENGMPVRDDADANAFAIWQRVDSLLHDLNHEWLDIFSSYRADGPEIVPVEDGDGSATLTSVYQVVI